MVAHGSLNGCLAKIYYSQLSHVTSFLKNPISLVQSGLSITNPKSTLLMTIIAAHRMFPIISHHPCHTTMLDL